MQSVFFDPKVYYREARKAVSPAWRAPFGGRAEIDETSDFVRLPKQCGPAMQQLIRRYGLHGRSVISIGAGRAHEEFWLHKAGCRLTLVDNFEGYEFDEAYKARLEQARTTRRRNAVEYLVGDFFEFIAAADETSAAFDVCYVSSFAPDELDREAIQASYRKRLSAQEKYESYQSWPEGMPPFLQAIMDCSKLLKPGGLFLLQSYRGGVDVEHNPHYPRMIREQMELNGLIPLELHYFERSPAVIHLAAVKGAQEARERRRRLATARPIEEFHGRFPDAEVRSRVKRLSFDPPAEGSGEG